MAALFQLQKQLVDYKTCLYNEGFLDEQFTQLEELQDECNPDFVDEVVTLFFEDSERHLNDLTKAFIGAQRVQNVCIPFRNYCEEQNVEGCLKCLAQVKNEYFLVKNKLDTLLKLEKRFLGAGGSLN